MRDHFLRLKAADRAQILDTVAQRVHRDPVVLEKDVWVCWSLSALFDTPDRLSMAFKGGTSLSKVFGAIARFSEDIDVTVDHRALDETLDPFAAGLSRSRLKALSVKLAAKLRAHVHEIIAPRMRDRLSTDVGASGYSVEVSDDGEKLRVRYRSALRKGRGYLDTSVLLEFGGRNTTTPSSLHEVIADVSLHVEELEFPRAMVPVLSPTRTFWEKATLMHSECNRPIFRTGATRLARHWYDLAMLADLEHGRAALADRALLADVVRHKKVFYNSRVANYDACLAGGLRLVPDANAVELLRADLARMIEAGMFVGAPPVHDDIISRLKALEGEINR